MSRGGQGRLQVCVWGEGGHQQGLVEFGMKRVLEDDAFSFLHPGVVLHQLRVEEGIFGDALLDPLHQVSDCFGGLLPLEGQLVLEALHLLLHLGQVHLIHDCS